MSHRWRGTVIVGLAGLIDFLWVRSGVLFFLTFLAMYVWNSHE